MTFDANSSRAEQTLEDTRSWRATRNVHAAGTVARNAFFLVLGQVTTTALAIVLNAALARFLGTADFGVYYLITTMCAFAYVFVEGGQQMYVVGEVAKDPARAGEMLGTALPLRTVVTVLVAAGAWMVAGGLRLDGRSRLFAVLLILASLPLSLAQSFGLIFRGNDRMGLDAAISVSNKVLLLVFTVPLLALGAGLSGVVGAGALAGGAALAVAALLYRRLRAARLRPSYRTARELVAGGAPMLAMGAVVTVQPYLDALVLSWLAPPDVLGWFGAARNILGTLIAPATILGLAAYTRLARAAGSQDDFRSEVGWSLRAMLWLGALAALGTYVFAGPVITAIYGGAFSPAAAILRAFAPGFFLLFIDMLLTMATYAAGRMTVLVVAKTVSVAAGVGLNFILVPWFQAHAGNGGIGVVVSFAVTELIVFAGVVLALPRGALGGHTVYEIARAVLAAAATLAVLRLLPPVPPWVGVPLCVATFVAMSRLTRLLRSEDVALAKAALWSRLAAQRSDA
jgi:O-antigen/teichoic acid export membrane protein